MATSNRDVRLGVRVETSGTEELQALAGNVRDVGAAAGASAPGVDKLARQLDELTAATIQRREAERTARAEEAAARKALDDRRDTLARLRASADAATRATDEHRAAVRAERLAIVDAIAALRERRAAASEAAAAAKQAATAQREAAATLAAGLREQAAAAKTTGSTLDTLRGQYSLLQSVAATALGGTLVGSLARDLASTADGFNNLSARVRIATGDGEAFGAAMTGIEGIAQRTGATLETTGTLFTRVLQAGKEVNLSQGDALALTETITQAVQVSGAAAASADAAITQLIQGLQSGVLRGEEFNSVMEQAPRLAQALAAALGVTLGELRNLAQQGALTSQTVIDALRGQSQAIQTEYDKLPPTVERAVGRLASAWQVYIGQTDSATGASATAARAIETVANNLDTLGNVLLGLGKAAAAYSVIRVVAGYFSATAVATASATAATVAHTAALQANTAAQVANSAAGTAGIGVVGRIVSALSALKTFSVVAILANVRELGAALGEGAAKLAGWGKVLEENERKAAADEEATRRNAAAKAAMAQAAAKASDAALGLTKDARALVSEFEGVATKSGDVTDALGKLSKAMRLDDVAGIRAAGAALDALALRGKLTGEQIRTALGDALKGADLLVFETNARAAFDGSEQGARRLRAALDAISDQALSRAGTSLAELQTGFSKASTSAINDVDALAATLRGLNTTGDDAGRVLGTALDKALTAASTERAVQAVIDRIEELGRAGLLTGDRLAEGLGKARQKLDELRPGVSSLAEAYRTLGLQTRDDAQRTADKLGEAYRAIAASGTAGVRDLIDGYAKWREAALRASGGVESGHLAEQRVILENRAAVAGLGDTYAQAMAKAEAATRSTTAALNDQRAALAGTLGDGSAQAARNAAVKSTITGAQYDSAGFALNADGSRVTGTVTTPPPDNSGDYEWIPMLNQNAAGGEWRLSAAGAARRAAARSDAVTRAYAATGQVVPARGVGTGGTPDNAAVVRWLLDNGYTAQGAPGSGPRSEALRAAAASAPAAAVAPTVSSGVRTIRLELPGVGSTNINVASAADAAALEAWFRQLEQAAARAGGGGGSY